MLWLIQIGLLFQSDAPDRPTSQTYSFSIHWLCISSLSKAIQDLWQLARQEGQFLLKLDQLPLHISIAKFAFCRRLSFDLAEIGLHAKKPVLDILSKIYVFWFLNGPKFDLNKIYGCGIAILGNYLTSRCQERGKEGVQWKLTDFLNLLKEILVVAGQEWSNWRLVCSRGPLFSLICFFQTYCLILVFHSLVKDLEL